MIISFLLSPGDGGPSHIEPRPRFQCASHRDGVKRSDASLCGSSAPSRCYAAQLRLCLRLYRDSLSYQEFAPAFVYGLTLSQNTGELDAHSASKKHRSSVSGSRCNASFLLL